MSDDESAPRRGWDSGRTDRRPDRRHRQTVPSGAWRRSLAQRRGRHPRRLRHLRVARAVIAADRAALAAAPAVSAPAALVPLTDERLDAVLSRFAGGCEWSDDEYDTAAKLARAIEAAHGIQAPVTGDQA